MTWVAVPRVSQYNRTTAALGGSATYTGTYEDVQHYPSVIIALKMSSAGTLYVDFSPDAINTDSTLSFDVAAATNEVHRITVTRQWFRIRITNASPSDQSYLRAQVLLGGQTALTSPLTTSMQADSDSTPVRAVLHGQQDSGLYAQIHADTNGHLEVAMHSPKLPFGALHAESLYPVIQKDAVYGLDTTNHNITINASGTATASESLFTCTAGTTVYGAGTIQSRRRLRYRPGQGVVSRFTGLYSARVEDSYQLIGMGHAEDGVYFGYVPSSVNAVTEFGILYSRRGYRAVHTLTISTKSSTAENVTVQLNGVNFSVAVTNGASTVTTAWEISQGTFTGWNAEQSGSTVIFVANSAGPKSSTFSLTASTAIGSFVTSRTGVLATETFYPKSQWNGDRMDGSLGEYNPSGVTLNPAKLNVYQINLQYLGAGALVFQIEYAPEGNNATWATVHSMTLPNTLTTTSFGNPSFPFLMTAYSYGSTTDFSVKSGSYAGFIEGYKLLSGQRLSYTAQSTAVTTAVRPLFTVRNSRYFGGRSNQTVINLVSVEMGVDHNFTTTLLVYRNATLTGPTNFTSYATGSCTYWDTTSTGATIADNNQLIWSGAVGGNGNLDHPFEDEITLQPGETITIAAKTVSGTVTSLVASLNTREDQ